MQITDTRLNSGEASKAVTFRFPGDVLSTTADQLRESLDKVLQGSAARAGSFQYFDADLRSARMVDSVGLNLLVWLWRVVTARGAKLRLRISSADIERTFRFTRLSERAEVQLEPTS
jgi:anti-anti-sigma factor